MQPHYDGALPALRPHLTGSSYGSTDVPATIYMSDFSLVQGEMMNFLLRNEFLKTNCLI